MNTTIDTKCIEIAHNAILDKGYSIFDFDISNTEKRDSVKVTRKSQNITCFYNYKKSKKWVNEFQKDLDFYAFG